MRTLLFILFTVLVNSSCNNNFSSQFPYETPLNLKDGLRIGNLSDVGMDEDMLRKAVGRIEHGKYGQVHSMLIYKNDKLVFEEYYEGHRYQWDAPGHRGEYVTWNRDMPHCIHSDTKSITSLCIGIAIEEGFIKNVNQSIFDYLPGFESYKTDGKEKITVSSTISDNLLMTI